MSCVNQQKISFKCECLISDEKHVSCQMKPGGALSDVLSDLST